jgi:hypothetical protein
MEGTTRGAGLYQQVKKVLQSLYNPIQTLAGLVTDGAPSTIWRKSGVSSLITSDVKNTKNSSMIMSLLDKPRKMCAKSLKVMNVVMIVSKLVNFVMSKGMNHRQFKEFLSNTESEYRNALYST